MAERQLPKLNVAGSIPVSRSIYGPIPVRSPVSPFRFPRLQQPCPVCLLLTSPYSRSRIYGEDPAMQDVALPEEKEKPRYIQSFSTRTSRAFEGAHQGAFPWIR